MPKYARKPTAKKTSYSSYRRSVKFGSKFPKARAAPFGDVSPHKFVTESATIVNTNTGGIPDVLGNLPSALTISAITPYSAIFSNYSDIGIALKFDPTTDLKYWSNWSALYEEFMLTGVAINVQMLSNQASTVSSGVLSTLYWAFDQGDAVIPSKQSDVSGKTGAQVHNFDSRTNTNIYIKPRPQLYLLGTGVSSQKTTSTQTWISTDDTSAPHYALKMWLSNFFLGSNASGTNSGIRFTFSYYIKFRKARYQA